MAMVALLNLAAPGLSAACELPGAGVLPHSRPHDAGAAGSGRFATRPTARCAARTQTQAKLASMVRPGQASGAKMRITRGFLTVKGSLCPQFHPRVMSALLTRAIRKG